MSHKLTPLYLNSVDLGNVISNDADTFVASVGLVNGTNGTDTDTEFV
jgi:hypothetical protein